MTFYPLASSTWASEEYKALYDVISSGKFTMGSKVGEYESEFAKKFGSRFAVMFNSGSSANLALFAALRYMKDSPMKIGSNVIVPSVSWSTTYYPVNQLGFKLNFVDIDISTLNIDITKIEEAINEETSAIFAVNLLGNPCEMNALRDIARRHNLLLIEDNCESMGARFQEQQTGTFGIAGTYSSFFSHHISTMEGGIVVTDSESLMQTLKSVRAHGWTRELPPINFVHDKSGDDWDDLFRFVIPGYNLRPLELEGAVGLEQIKKLDSIIFNRRKNADFFFSKIKHLKHYLFQKETGESSWFGFSIILTGNLRGKRRLLIELLRRSEIETRPIVAGNFTLNPVMKHLSHLPVPDLPHATELHNNGFFVGNHHFEIEEQIEQLVQILTDFEDSNGK